MAVLRSMCLAEAGFVHGFPERGTDEERLSSALGVGRIVTAVQVHGARAVDASEAEGREADAVVAIARGVALAVPFAVGVRVADCVPVLVADRRTGSVAAVHTGWRGVVCGVLKAAVERLDPRELVAAIGPCIGACCFEVGRDVADAIAGSCAETNPIVRVAGDKAFVDLRAAVRDQLRALGARAPDVDDVAGCTKHEPRFHSFRRDGAGSGRMLAAIVPRDRSPFSTRSEARSIP